MKALGQAIEHVYGILEGGEDVNAYHFRHQIEALLILTILDKRTAKREAARLRERIHGRTVVEIGAGVGLAACEMARYAKRVYAIEADPAWTWVFTRELYRSKPPNLTWIFGTAESVQDFIKADIAVMFTRSGTEQMARAALRMAPSVLHVYSEGTKEYFR